MLRADYIPPPTLSIGNPSWIRPNNCDNLQRSSNRTNPTNHGTNTLSFPVLFLTPLHHACFHDRPQITRYLLSLDKTSLTKSDKSGYTPVQLAKRRGSIAMLRVLAYTGCTSALYRPAHTHARDLLLATASAPATDLQRFVRAFQAWVNWRNADGRCALHWASLRGDVDVVKTLLELGANPDRPDRWGVTPRIEALRIGGDVAQVFEKLFG